LGIKAGEPGYYRQNLSIKTGFFVRGRRVSSGDEQTPHGPRFALIAYDAAGHVLYKISPVPYS
jgi:hypothetical protein